MSQEITKEQIAAFDADFSAQRANRVAMNAVTNNGLLASAIRREAVEQDVHEYSISLEQGEICNQKQSGRCWMFAALNTLRYQVMKKYDLKTFELSQAYLFFWDKLEKSNYFLESILETLDEPSNGRLISHLVSAPLNDGGQWDMLCNLINKYGLVPKAAMPESVISSATQEMNSYMTEKLREFACILRKAHKDGASIEQLRQQKEEMLATIYNMLCISLGKPPKNFDFEYRDKDGNFHRDCGLTPKSFYDKYIGVNVNDYISLINAPTEDKPFFKSYSVSYLGNVKEGRPVKYVNLPIEELKKAAIAQMQDGEPVWFGCDVGKRGSRTGGILDLDIYDLDGLFGTHFGMNKAERLEYGQSQMTHAMVFQGVNLDENGNPNRWRVENSWGEDACKDGYYVMSDRWFEEYTYQIVVNKKYLPKEVVEIFESEPIMLEPWDPMGSLAR